MARLLIVQSTTRRNWLSPWTALPTVYSVRLKCYPKRMKQFDARRVIQIGCRFIAANCLLNRKLTSALVSLVYKLSFTCAVKAAPWAWQWKQVSTFRPTTVMLMCHFDKFPPPPHCQKRNISESHFAFTLMYSSSLNKALLLNVVVYSAHAFFPVKGKYGIKSELTLNLTRAHGWLSSLHSIWFNWPFRARFMSSGKKWSALSLCWVIVHDKSSIIGLNRNDGTETVNGTAGEMREINLSSPWS